MLHRPDDLDALIERRPPSNSLRWAERQIGPGTAIQQVRPLPGAWASAVHAFGVVLGDESAAARESDPLDPAEPGRRHQFVLRRHVWAEALAADPGLISREVAVLRAIEAHPGDIAAPRIIAVDADASSTDVPAVLQSLLPGRVRDSPGDSAGERETFARQLAGTAAAIRNGPTAGIDARYEPWNSGVELTPPPRSRRIELWERAFAIFDGGPPDEVVGAGEAQLVHRDFHPGNVLWRQGSVSGVVDWVHACVGPPAVDVAHCRLNLVVRLDLGRGCADALLDESVRLGARWDPWFDVAEVISWLPVPSSSPRGWFTRAQDHLERALVELGG